MLGQSTLNGHHSVVKHSAVVVLDAAGGARGVRVDDRRRAELLPEVVRVEARPLQETTLAEEFLQNQSEIVS